MVQCLVSMKYGILKLKHIQTFLRFLTAAQKTLIIIIIII